MRMLVHTLLSWFLNPLAHIPMWVYGLSKPVYGERWV